MGLNSQIKNELVEKPAKDLKSIFGNENIFSDSFFKPKINQPLWKKESSPFETEEKLPSRKI